MSKGSLVPQTARKQDPGILKSGAVKKAFAYVLPEQNMFTQPFACSGSSCRRLYRRLHIAASMSLRDLSG
jgi:hypothetical protein